MRFSTIFSVLACGAMALAAAVAPDALISRSNNEIDNVLGDLDGKCDSILPKFDSCKDSKCAEGVTLEIVAAVNVATAACVNLKGVVSLKLAEKIFGIIAKIVAKLDLFKSSCDGKCGDLSIFAKIDVCIQLLLSQLGICVPGILVLVSTLVIKIVAVLKLLSLKLILKVCLL